ncbi:MAG: exopolyphosphatase [Desulfobacterales bacterium]|jgi:exopolyphosphatase/guanosine-5'-triphosphate,3'-diphosphate pyrophosphatase
MKSNLKFAAIDIGSNAVRLLLSEVFEKGHTAIFRKISLIRMPIRLGEDAFIQHRISDAKISQLVQSMIGFKHLINAYGPLGYMACATSAMREAENGPEICARINEQANIKVDIIDGSQEAQILFSNSQIDLINKEKETLYVDVGGGSTEISLLSHGEVMASKSFNIGTVRLLAGLVSKVHWDQMKDWLKKYSSGSMGFTAIGSGGNINTTFRLTHCKRGQPLSYNKIRETRRYIKKFSIQERITELALRPDRADVILPALEIYLKVLKWCGVRQIYVPEMGLADGIIRDLYKQHKQASIKKGNR